MALRDRLPLPRPKREPDYSLTIVNIVLLLIFFFLVAGQMTTAPSIPVQLSETARLPIEALPKPILIWEADDAITLDEVPVTPADLPEVLKDLTILHLFIDRDEPADALLTLLTNDAFAHLEIRLVTINQRTTP